MLDGPKLSRCAYVIFLDNAPPNPGRFRKRSYHCRQIRQAWDTFVYHYDTATYECMHATTPLHLRFSMPKAWISGGKRHAVGALHACFRHAEACRWRDKSGRQDTRSRRFSVKNRIFIPNRSRHISATPVVFFQMRSLQVAFQGHKTMKIPYKSTYGPSAQTQRRKTSARHPSTNARTCAAANEPPLTMKSTRRKPSEEPY